MMMTMDSTKKRPLPYPDADVVADTDNGRIRAVRVSSGEVTTYAGSVVGTKDGMRLAGLISLSPVTASAASSNSYRA